MDPLRPAAPRAAYFDAERKAWIISRYADVLAALREPALKQERPAGKRSNREAHTRTQTLAAAPHSRELREWCSSIERSAHERLGALPCGEPVDLLREVIRPWTLNAAILALRDGPAHQARLLRLNGDQTGGSSIRRKLARAEFELVFRKRPGEKSVFIGISETLPGFLANSCVALLQEVEALEQLRAQPELTASAVEELLRYAGLVHSLVRCATCDLNLFGVRISAGEKVILKLAEANRDPEQFTDPNRLEVTRRAAGNLALGHGEHSCAGAAPLRAATSILIRAILDTFSEIRLAVGLIEWRWGDTLVSPATVPIIARR